MAKIRKTKPKDSGEYSHMGYIFSAEDVKPHLKLMGDGVSLQVIHQRHPRYFNIPYPKDENGVRVISYRESLLTLVSFRIANYMDCITTMEDEYFTQMFKSLYYKSVKGATRTAKNTLIQWILNESWNIVRENLTIKKRMAPNDEYVEWFGYFTDFINNKILALII